MAKKAKEVNPEAIRKPNGKEAVSAGRDWKAEGISTAKQLVELEQGVDGRRLDIVLQEAEMLSGNKESITAFMEGVGQALIEAYGKETAKFRKGEIKAIIEAYAIDKVALCNGKGWHDTVKIARGIRPSLSKPKGEREKIKLTDKQADTVKELVESADASQSATIIHNALVKLGTYDGTNLFLVNAARTSLNRVKGEGRIKELVESALVQIDALAEAVKADAQGKQAADKQGKEMADAQAAAGNKMLKAA